MGLVKHDGPLYSLLGETGLDPIVLLPHIAALVGSVHRAGDLMVLQGELLVVVIVYSFILSVVGIVSFCEGLELSSLVPLGSGDIERRIIGFSNTLDKVVIAGHHVRAVISDRDPSDGQLDNLGCLSMLVELLGGLAVGIKEEGLEGHPALGDVVDLGHGSDHVVSRGPVELVVLSLLVLIRLPHPEGLDTLDHLVAGHAGEDVDLVSGRGSEDLHRREQNFFTSFRILMKLNINT